MRRLLSTLALATACTLPLGGCATLLGGFVDPNPEVGVIVQEPEQGAEITLLGLQRGDRQSWTRNSVRVRLDKSQDYKLTVRARGYEPQDFMIMRKTNGLVLGNFCCVTAGVCTGCLTIVLLPVTAAVGCLGTGIGFGVDYMTGNAYSFQQPDLYVTLKKPEPGESSGLPIELRDGSGRLLMTRVAPRVR